MRLLNREGVLKVGGDLGGLVVTSKMGNGTKFRLSSVLPNVFNKIKGIRRNSSVQKLPSSASVLSESASIDIDQKDFSRMTRDSRGDRSPSPERIFPQNRNGEDRYLSSPVHGQKSYDIRIPVESPIKSKGSNKSGPLSPSPPGVQNSADLVDPGCGSYDSTMALVPHDGRVRKVAPQPFGKCLIMSKCNSFNGSTHSDSEISETDSSRAHVRIRHSRAMSVQLERSSCEGYFTTSADDRGSHGASGKVSVRQRSLSQRIDKNVKLVEHSLEYGGSSPIEAVHTMYSSSASVGKCCRADHTRDSTQCRESAFLNSSCRERNDLDQGGSRRGRLSRKLSFTSEDNPRSFDDSSFSSEDDFYNKMATSNANKLKRGHFRSRSTSSNNSSHLQIYSRNPDKDLGYRSSEVVYTEDDRGHAAAILRREALLTKTVLNASDGWPQAQLSSLSQDERPSRRASYDDNDRYRKGDSGAAALSRETKLVETVMNAKGWTRENLRALAKANELDRRTLARIRAGDLLARNEEEADKVEYESFGLPPHSKDFFTHKSSRHSSPVGEVEKYTEGRVDYKSSSLVTKLSVHAHDTNRNVLHEELVKPGADYGSNLYSKSGRSQKSEKELGKPWDTEFPSFRSDSVLMGGGNGSDRTVPEERASNVDCSDSEVPTAVTPRYLERHRQNKIRVSGQQQDFKNVGKVSSRPPSPREEPITGGMKSFKISSQPASPRTTGRPKRSPSSIQELSNVKKTPSRPPSPNQEMNSGRNTSRTPSPAPSPAQDPQPVKKSSRTPSPARNQTPQTSPQDAPQDAAKAMTSQTEAGMQRLDSVAVVKASYDPYHDFRESMVEMILENDIRTAEDLEDLLQCYLSLNSSEYHKIIVQVFSDVWGDIFEQ